LKRPFSRAVSDQTKLRNKGPRASVMNKPRTIRHKRCSVRFLLFAYSLGYSSVVTIWQSDIYLLFKRMKILSDLLSMGAVLTCTIT